MPKRKTHVIRLNAKRKSANLISAITNQDEVRFRIFDGTMNADILIDFMQRLIKDARRKLFMILDNMPVHNAEIVKAWMAEKKDQIEVFYLPSYSPELNPDEYMNSDLKARVHGSTPIRSKADLKAKAIAHSRKLQKLPGRVMKYFRAEPIRYAACA